MELNCPQCAAHFTVPDGAIGPKGRKLKCAKCDHTWRQMPSEMDSVAADAPAAEAAADSAPPPAAPPREAAPQRAMAMAEDASPVPMEMEPGPRPTRETVSAGHDMPMDSAVDANDIDIDDPLAGLDFGDPLGGDMDDLGDLTGGEDANDLGSDTDLDDLLSSDPEPIPDMFAREDGTAPGRGKSRLLGALIGLILVIASAAGGLYLGRNQVVRALPEAEPAYAALGIPVDVLGIGLRFNDVTSERLVRDGADTLVVRGFIANTSSLSRDLPFLRLALFDATDALVQDMVAEPPQASLEPGATTGFRVQLKNPSAAARRFEVDWTEPPGVE